MTLIELFILAVGLSMDAMAVAICKGLSVQKLKLRHALITGLYFGGFQAGMPLIGYFLGHQFRAYIEGVDHWIAFVLLGLIGANMIKESFGKAEEVDCSFCPKAMLPMAVATSIDALAVGVTFALLPDVNVTAAVAFIGVITFSLSAVGVYIGHLFGAKFKSKAELAGGIVLILMGCKILLEHLGLLDRFFGLFS
jgi:putative Mn2+ efflux pump MntP